MGKIKILAKAAKALAKNGKRLVAKRAGRKCVGGACRTVAKGCAKCCE